MNAEAQRRRGINSEELIESIFSVFPPLRLCASAFILN
jgi:hypothetical protein